MFSNNYFQFLNNISYISTHFFTHIFPQMFLNNNFQFLNTHTKQTLNNANWVLKEPPISLRA